MKLVDHIKYKKNRFLTYYFLDFTPKERFILLRNLMINSVCNKRIKQIENEKFTNNLETFVISLENRNDRRKHCENEFKRNDIAFEFFTATDGEILRKEDSQYITKRSRANLSNGSIGCAISHMKIWESISKKDSANLYLIFEDDIVLTHDFNTKIQNLLTEIPIDFDLINLGGFNNRGRDIHYFVNNNLFKSYNPRRGLYGYIINSKSAKKLIDLIKPLDLIYGGIDTIIGKLTRNNKLKVYQMHPSIVEVNYNFTSNIFNYSERNKKKVQNNQQLTIPSGSTQGSNQSDTSVQSRGKAIG